MERITKNDGTSEPFEIRKLERSIRATGADEDTARGIAAGVDAREAATTADVRRGASWQLHVRDPDGAARYDSTRTAMAHATDELKKGTVCLSEDVVDQLDLAQGELVELRNDGLSALARLDRCDPETRELHMSHEDMSAINASEGLKVAVRKAS